jgi:hypothetical protein
MSAVTFGLLSLTLVASALIGASARVPDGQAGCPPCQDQLPQGSRVVGSASATRADGTVETLVAFFVRDASFSAAELGRLGAIAVQEAGGQSRVYRLGDDLGENPAADLQARDLTGDGGPELALRSAVGVHGTVLKIFRWSGSRYDVVGDFFGDSGVNLNDVDGDGVPEVVVGMRLYDRAQLRSEATLGWDGAAYRARYARLGFTFDPAEVQQYPEAVVLRYYQAIGAKDYRAAYDLLGGGMRAGQTYASFAAGFGDLADLRVEDLEVTREEAESAQVRVALSTTQVDGSQHRYEGTWTLERAGESWRLVGSYVLES